MPNIRKYDSFQIRAFLYGCQEHIDRVWRTETGCVMLKPAKDANNKRVDALARVLVDEGLVREDAQTLRFRLTDAGRQRLEKLQNRSAALS